MGSSLLHGKLMRTLLKSIDRRGLARLLSVTIMPEAVSSLSKPLRRRRPHLLVFLPIFGALALTLCAASQPGGMPRAQKHESRREIFKLEEAWRNAVLKGNAATMDSLLADDYLAITPNGTLQSKEQALANLRSGATHITSIEISDRKVRFYGTTALVTSRAEVSGANAGGEISGSYRYTRVYARDERGKWKIVSFEASRIREADEPK
jgi:ketosteroid isomerase-like protein